ncbi:MAG TPA: site-specific integrase [Azospirillaceae bacterium]|nr:site-specific integrase [Azospirillaceae bacterium]
MATIRKRGNRWQVQVRRQGMPHLSQSFLNKCDAEAWARQMEVAADRLALPTDTAEVKRLRVRDLLERYLRDVTVGKKGRTQEAARIQGLLKTKLAAAPLGRPLSAELAKFIQQRLASVSGSTVNRELNIIGHCFETARRDWGLAFENPVPLIRRPPNASPRDRRIKGPEEFQRISEALDSCRNPLIRPLVLFAIETGMRRSEMIRIRWEHQKGRTLHIPDTKTGFPRTIPLSPKAITILDELRSRGGAGPFPLTAEAIKLAWKRLRDRAGAPDLNFHDLRHEAVSSFFERGLSMPEVALISGHRDTRMLMRYTHLRPEEVALKLG